MDDRAHEFGLDRWVRAVTIPVLVIRGDSDRIFTPGYGRAYAGSFPDGRFALIADAGHLPQLEQPAATLAESTPSWSHDDAIVARGTGLTTLTAKGARWSLRGRPTSTGGPSRSSAY